MNSMRILLSLLSLPLPAFAQPPPPPCWASNWGGAGTVLHTYANEDGQVRYWFCQRQFDWGYHGMVCRFDPGTRACAIPTGLSLTASPSAMWTRYIASDWNSAQWADIMDRAKLTIEPFTPAPPVYVVAKNGTSPTRPVYAFTAGASAPSTGARGTRSVGVAPVGSLCDCAQRVVGSTIYCGVPGGVSACVKKP